MSTVYGPVSSWRFGRSLGIDVIVTPKTCTFNCIYCQLGKTVVKVSGPQELENYVTTESVESDLEKYLEEVDVSSLDAVTFSGSGEPTLNPDLGNIVDRVRSLIGGGVPLIILTNASLLHRDDVRRNVVEFDIVAAKLDAGDEKAYRVINRPTMGMPRLETIKESIKKIRDEMSGKLMTQTMFLRTAYGFTNCKGDDFNNLMKVLIDVEPDVIQIDTPYRPSGERFVKPAPVEELKGIAERFRDYLGEKGARSRLWVFGIHDKRGKRASWRMHRSISVEILELLKRRPCRVFDIADSLAIPYGEAFGNVEELLHKDLIQERKSNGEKYFHCR
jgi:wyosine [tRNA(Phe)-imidazoG37] synthetase (radical SAM superfamily)